jgi:hypothetical protein
MVSASDTNATRILQGALQNNGYVLDGMTAQQQANAVLTVLVNFLQQSALAREVTVAVEDARQGAIDNPPVFGA